MNPLAGMMGGPMGMNASMFADMAINDAIRDLSNKKNFYEVITGIGTLLLLLVTPILRREGLEFVENLTAWIKKTTVSIMSLVKSYGISLITLVQGFLIAFIYTQSVKLWHNARSKWIWRKKKISTEVKTDPQVQVKTVKSKFTGNVVTTDIDLNNQVDLKALTFHVMENDYMQSKSYIRSDTTQYNVTEEHVLSPYLKWKGEDDITITFRTTANVKVFYENGATSSILKDVNVSNKNSQRQVNFYELFENLEQVLVSHEMDTKKFTQMYKKFEIEDFDLKFDEKGWTVCDRGIYNGQAWMLEIPIMYYNDQDLFKRLAKMAAGEEPEKFIFDGCDYTICGKSDNIPHAIRKGQHQKVWETTEYVNMRDTVRQKINELSEKDRSFMVGFMEKIRGLMRPVKSRRLTLYFSSPTKTIRELREYSRLYMDKQVILDYYNRNQTQEGSKITIYKAYIAYDVEKEKVKNPEYEKWMNKYGDEEKREKKRKEKLAKKKKKAAEAKKKKKEGEDSKKDGDNENSKEDSDDDNSDSDSDDDFDEFEDELLDVPMYGGKRGKRGKKAGGYPAYDGYGAYAGAYTARPVTPPKPSEFIEQDKMIPKAETKVIKKDKKSLEYLYLQKDFQSTLRSYLKNFKENKDDYDKFGIPYKGGILMSGSPGCGKSSTIVAIATYLGMNIFYMDLKPIKTNNEFKMLVDKCTSHTNKGAVIIFEDIDVMTDIVLRRADTVEEDAIISSSITKALNPGSSLSEGDSPFSLSFLLNVLDGTMAPEKTIFVMTTNHKNKLDPALIRPGRMDIDIELARCDRFQLCNIFKDLYGRELDTKLVERFVDEKYMVAEVILHLFHNKCCIDYMMPGGDHKLMGKFLEPVVEEKSTTPDGSPFQLLNHVKNDEQN